MTPDRLSRSHISKNIGETLEDATQPANSAEAAQRSDNSHYRKAMETAGLSIWDYDMRAKRILPVRRGAWLGGRIPSGGPESLVANGWIHPDSAQAFLDIHQRLHDGEPYAEGVFRVQDASRTEYRYKLIQYTNVYGKNGKPVMAVGISQDVTEKYAAQHNYARELRLQQMLPPDIYATMLLDVTDWQVLRFQCRDPLFSETMHGLGPDAIFANAAATVVDNEEVRRELQGFSRESLQEMYAGERLLLAMEYQRALPGGARWVREDLSLFLDQDIGHLMAQLQIKDVDSEKRRIEALSLAADTDSMTGFFNHEATMRRMGGFLAGEGHEGRHALFFIDIDNLKDVNDQLGHIKGDEAITKIATALRSLFRSSDMMGRVGGDEFLILMKDVSGPALAEKKAAELVEALQFSLADDTATVSLSVSVGICLYNKPGIAFEDLYAGVDAAMYCAKNAGKHRYAISIGDDRGAVVQERNPRPPGSARLRTTAQESTPGLSEERYRAVVTLGNTLLWEIDMTARALRLTPEVAKRFGYADTSLPNVPEALIGQGYVHPDSETALLNMYSDLYAGRDNDAYYLRCQLDGEFHWTRARFHILRDESGAPYYALGNTEPIPGIEADMLRFEQEQHLANLTEGSLLAQVHINVSRDRIEYFSISDTLYTGEAPRDCGELAALFARFTADDDPQDAFPAAISLERLRGMFSAGERFPLTAFRRRDTHGDILWTDCSIGLFRHPVSGELYAFITMRDSHVRRSFEATLQGPVAYNTVARHCYTAETAEALTKTMLEHSRTRRDACALSILKLVGLEQIRAKKGAANANELFATIARLCRLIVDPNVVIGRLNGTQLSLFRLTASSPDIQQTRILQLRERVLKALDSIYPDAPVNLVLGFDTERLQDASYGTLLHRALLACQSAVQMADTPIVRYTNPHENGMDAALPAHNENETQRHTVLIADDSPSYLEMLHFLFEENYTVLEAENGADALVCMRAHPGLSAVILDLLMPEMDGFQVLEAMRADPALSRVPVIVVTSEDDPTSETRALDLGAADVISKPYYGQTMLRRVRNTIARSDTARIAEQNRAYELRFQQQANMLRLADYDELTGIFNKRAFCAHVREALGSNPKTVYAIFRWDLDRFKVFNDIFGTQAGDTLLREIGAFLHSTAVPGCIYGHLESDHFAICMPQSMAAENSISAAIEAWFKHYPLPFNFSPRFGIYVVDEPDVDVSLMCDRALLALRTVKGSYSNAIAYYDDSLRHRLLDEQELIGSMQEAIDREEFVLHFQPQYNYDTGELVGAEALVRWMHPTRGLLSPAVFIPLFENNGFISTLDEYIWEHCCRTMRYWLDNADKLVPISLSVNISRMDIFNPKLCQTLKSLVEKYGIPPAFLKLEITESAYMETPEQLIEVVSTLQGMGFMVEMDDFGSGYSSLNTLKDVPVDVLKLDMKFLSFSDNDSRGGNILSSVIRMARWLQLPVIAEGVETKEQADYLNSLGCTYMQGFLFSRPLSAEAFDELLTKSRLGGVQPLLPIQESAATDVDGLLWDASSQTALIFNKLLAGAAIMEYSRGNLEALRINARYLQALGTTRKDYARWQTHVLSHISPDTRPLYVDMLDRAIQTGQEAACETLSEPLCTGGVPFWLRNRALLLSKSGDSYLFYIAVENITQRKELESGERLHSYQEILAELFDETLELDYAQDVITVRSSKFLGAEQAGRILPLGNLASVWSGQWHIAPDGLAALQSLTAPRGPRKGSTEYRLIAADGKERRVAAFMARLGQDSYLLCGRDITDSVLL